VARIAIRAVVYVPANALVLLVGLTLGVTIRAREHGVVRGVGVTRRTDSVRAAVICREPSVIEYRALPGCSAVTRLAGCRETCSSVVRIGCALVVLLMTAIAGRREGRVIVVYVTARTERCNVRAGQRECGVVVIEKCRRPRGSGVTNITSLRETCRRMIRVVRAVVVLHVARSTGGASEVVISVYVTLSALHIRVSTG